jgi:hypothetical protein
VTVVADRDDVRPVAAGYCYRCGFAPCMAQTDSNCQAESDGTCSRDLAAPLTQETWLTLAAGDAVRAVFGTAFPLVGLDPQTRRLVAALQRRLGLRIAGQGGGGHG